jgi:ferrochelatase
LLFSLHGIPERYVSAGDPYADQCRASVRAIADALELDDERYQLCFQSRFGREPWLQPYTDITLEAWARAGVRHVQVVCPGFAADCIETLEEIDMQNRELFLTNGGERFEYIPCLNDEPAHIAALADIVRQDW